MNPRVVTARILLTMAFLAPFLWIFRGAISTTELFVFRDAAHYYHPLFQWTASEWSHGRLPLWNPYENCGTPTVADPTASIFYPGKLVFALPLEFDAKYKLYILAHGLLAGGAAWLLARRWKASPAAATACAISYAYGGSVVFQYCNVVYLVSAAWLPLAFWSAAGLLRHRRWSWACGLGAVWAMMILGGDPQTAYHSGLVTVLGAWLHGRRARKLVARVRRQSQTPQTGETRSQTNCPALPSPAPRRTSALRGAWLLLGGAALMAGLLAAVQILPASRWTERSDRAASDAPRSVYEAATWLAARSAADHPPRTVAAAMQSLIGPPARNMHHETLYQFSVGPWRWAEFLWPNFAGRSFPIHRRWTTAIPAEGRVWTPSLYVGLAPLLAALSVWRLGGTGFRTRWLCWTALLALIAALGGYGIGWLWQELRHALGHANLDETTIGAPTGGLYWMLVNLLPGYAYFRYPAKWLPVASLAISLLAARGWDRTWRKPSVRVRRLTLGAFLLSVLGLAIWLALRPVWGTMLAQAPADDLFGPLDVNGAAADLLFSLFQTAVLSGVFLVFLMRRRATTRPHASAALLAVIVTAVDLSLAHGWLAPTAPAELWRRSSPAVARMRQDAVRNAVEGSLRVFRASQAHWLPGQWKHVGSVERQRAGLIWERATLYPKYNLPAGLALAESRGSLAAADYQAVLAVARQRGIQRPDGVREPAAEVLRLLGVHYALLPSGAPLPGGRVVASPLEAGDVANVTLWRTPPPLPRAWVVNRVVPLAELDDPSPTALRRRARDVLLTDNRWRDFRQEAVVETNAPMPEAPSPSGASETVAAADCQLAVDEPQRVEVDVRLSRPGLMVLQDYYDANWQASYQPEGKNLNPVPLEILRTNRVLRGVWLPAGAGRVQFIYRPQIFYIGAIISGISLAVWIIWVIWPVFCSSSQPDRLHRKTPLVAKILR